MFLICLQIIPLIGILIISTNTFVKFTDYNKTVKIIGLIFTLINLAITQIIYILFDFSSNQFQFVQDYFSSSSFFLYVGLDGLSIYFVLLISIIMPISILAN